MRRVISLDVTPMPRAIEYINRGVRQHGRLVGFSAGAIDVSNIAGLGLSRANRIDVVSLPIFNIAPANTNTVIGSTDIVNGGILGKVFNPSARVANASTYDHTRFNYRELNFVHPGGYNTDAK